jgi:hypothetical protein
MQYYKTNRPRLTIEHTYSYYSNTRCWSEDKFEITSSCPLSEEQIKDLFNSGFLGMGQSFYIKNYNAEPAGYDESRLFDTLTNDYVSNSNSLKVAYYKYYTEVTCDSGD